MNKLHKLVAAVLVVAPLALAQQQTRVYNESGNWTQEITGSLGNARNLHVQVEVGTIKVYGGSQQGITYSIHTQAPGSEERARRSFDGYKINASVRGDTAWITAEWEEDRPHRFNGEFVINVPRDMDSAKIETDGGSVQVQGITGRVDAQTGGGGIRLEDIGASIKAETGGGNIDIGRVGGELSIETGGGTIRIGDVQGKIDASSGGGNIEVNSCQQETTLETGGGSIRVQSCNSRVKASTGGGSIDIGDIGGPAELETGGGSIRLASAKGLVRAETGGGTIELNGVPAVHAETGAGSIIAHLVSGVGHDSSLETNAGDITLYIAPNVHVAVQASIEVASGHTIHSDFPEIVVHSDGNDWGPHTVTAEGSLNGGGPSVKISTTTGDIYIRRGQ